MLVSKNHNKSHSLKKKKKTINIITIFPFPKHLGRCLEFKAYCYDNYQGSAHSSHTITLLSVFVHVVAEM